MEKELQMIQKTAQIDNISSAHCSFNLLGFQSFIKLVNAGGFDVMDVYGTSCSLIFTEGITLFGGGSNNPKLGEARYSDINPGIDDFIEKTKDKRLYR